ncbi:hypothetical protein [Maritalea sp.]|jgi:very-short-patch-repair endonuclease|uniref:hypothetical protein n=1 Tax=Maritalea sp. TaxID=2003361 RepID=UPI0039E5F78B
MSYSASPNHNRAPERRFVGKVALEPSGDHRILLHMDGTPFELDFTEEDARTAIKLLEQGLTQIMWECRLIGKIALEPSGDHRILLHMDGTPFELDFTEMDARRTIDLLQRGLEQIRWEDARLTDRMHRAVKGIE